MNVEAGGESTRQDQSVNVGKRAQTGDIRQDQRSE
jgi:hypothetical protein